MLNAPGELFEQLVVAHQQRWTHADELLALILTKLDELTILTARAWGDPKKMPRKVPRPFIYPRPNQPKKRRSTLAEIRAFFAR